MIVIPSFDPTAAKAGYIQVGSVDPGSKVLLYNLSIVNVLLNFDNGDSAILHAQEANYWLLDGSTTSIEWSQYSMLTTNGAAIAQVTGQVYRTDEQVIGTYPMSVSYQTNVGNIVSTAGGSMANLVNDGNAPASQIAEATVAGDIASAVSLTNDAILALGTALHKGSITLKGPLSTDGGLLTTDGNGNVTAASVIAAFANLAPSTVQVSGQAGTATLYQFMRGTIKAFLLYWSGWQDNSGSSKQLNLPTPFTTGGIGLIGGIQAGTAGIYFRLGATRRSTNQVTGRNAAIVGSTANQSFEIVEVPSGSIDNIQMDASTVAPATGWLFFIGI